MVFWLVALPPQGNPGGRTRWSSASAIWESLQEQTASAGYSQNSKLEVPELRVGTLDSLMELR